MKYVHIERFGICLVSCLRHALTIFAAFSLAELYSMCALMHELLNLGLFIL